MANLVKDVDVSGKRYSIVQVRKIAEQLQCWLDAALSMADEHIASDDRLDALNTRIDALQGAIDCLGEIE